MRWNWRDTADRRPKPESTLAQSMKAREWYSTWRQDQQSAIEAGREAPLFEDPATMQEVIRRGRD